MENQNNKQVFDAVDPEAMININIPGYMFMRINQLMFSGLGITKAEELIELTNKVRENNINKENSKEYHFETLLYINALISEEAKKQNKTKPFELDMNAPLNKD
jgi:hypothetical protein